MDQITLNPIFFETFDEEFTSELDFIVFSATSSQKASTWGSLLHLRKLIARSVRSR